MLRFVSNVVGLLLALLFFALPASAEITVSTEAWDVPSTQVRYLPNYSTENDWKSASFSVKGREDYVSGPFKFSVAARYSQIDGERIDRLDVDYRNDSFGLRLGILPYRVSWCRTYDESPWIKEPDAFCRFPGLAEVSTGGFGVQAYSSTAVGDWIVDGMVGSYKPSVDGQDKKLAIYVPVGPNALHDKLGASVNALNLKTGAQLRAAILRSWQNQNSATGGYQRQLRYDTIYIGAEYPLASTIDLRATVSAYIGDQVNPKGPYAFNAESDTIELIWRPQQGHTLSFGATQYTNITTYPTGVQRLKVPAWSAAYRKDFDNLYFIAQFSESIDDYTKLKAAQVIKSGQAFGVQFGATF